MEKFVILGSANAIPKLTQENTHLYAESGENRVLVDCGDNALVSLQKNGLDPNLISDLVITHFHPDHAGSLPNLLMGMWLEKRILPLTIHGLEFTLDRVKALLGLFGWNNWQNMYPVTFNTLPEAGEGSIIKEKGFTVICRMVKHLIPTVGLRFNFPDGKTVTYSCDTEPCDSLIELARGSQILVQESAGPGKGHTSAEEAGKIAASVNAQKLVLIHYEQRAGVSNLIKQAGETFSGEIVAAADGMTLF